MFGPLGLISNRLGQLFNDVLPTWPKAEAARPKRIAVRTK